MLHKNIVIFNTDIPPAAPITRERAIRLAGLLILAAFATTYLLSEDAVWHPKLLVLVMGWGGFCLFGGALRRTAPALFLISALVIVLTSWGLSWLDHPQWAETSPKVHRLTNWCAFIAVAWLLRGKTSWTLAVWSLAGLALLLTLWIRGDGIQEWLKGLNGVRVDFGLNNAQHTGMLTGTVFLGVLAYTRKILAPGRWQLVRTLAWVAALVVFGTALVISQTRTVWIGAFAGLCVYFIGLLVWIFRMPPQHKTRMMLTTLSGLILLTALAVYKLEPVIEKRLHAEQEIIEGLTSLKLKDDGSSSISYRTNSWKTAVPWIVERPLIGWGGNGRGLVLDHSPDLPDWFMAKTGHLHSTYVDTLVNFGLLGLALFLAILGWTLIRAYQAWRQDYMSSEMFLFLIAFSIFWLTINLTESYMYYSTGQYAFALVIGGIVTHIWRMQAEQR